MDQQEAAATTTTTNQQRPNDEKKIETEAPTKMLVKESEKESIEKAPDSKGGLKEGDADDAEPNKAIKHVSSNDEEESDSDGEGDNLYDKKWNAMFARLKAFKEQTGHCRVPNRYAEDTQLGNWVSTQRRQYRILSSGANKSVPLTRERAQQLIDIGFEWSAKDPTHKCWEDRFQELCEFKNRFGNTLVPMGWKENPRLATWVSTQRQEYKQLQNGHSSRLNEDKVKLLTSVGFVWEAQRGRRKLPNPLEALLSPGTVTRESHQKLKDAPLTTPPPNTVADNPVQILALLQQQLNQKRSSTPPSDPPCTTVTASAPSSKAADMQEKLLQVLVGQQPAHQHQNNAGGQLENKVAQLLKENPGLAQLLLRQSASGRSNEQPAGNQPGRSFDPSPLAQELGFRPSSQQAENRPSGASNAVDQNDELRKLLNTMSSQSSSGNPTKEQLLTLLRGNANHVNKSDDAWNQLLARINGRPRQEPQLSKIEELARLLNNHGDLPSASKGIAPQADIAKFLAQVQSSSGQRGMPVSKSALESLLSSGDKTSAKPPEQSKALAMISLYAASLPAGSPTRLALENSSSIDECQEILKLDILQRCLSGSLPAELLGQGHQATQQQQPSILDSLRNGSDQRQQQSAPNPVAYDLLREMIQGRADQNALQTALATSAQTRSSLPLTTTIQQLQRLSQPASRQGGTLLQQMSQVASLQPNSTGRGEQLLQEQLQILASLKRSMHMANQSGIDPPDGDQKPAAKRSRTS